MKKKLQRKSTQEAYAGFTIVEVMLALAISALMLIGVIGGVYISINQQRYSDALRDFAEYMRTVYSEVISPQTFGAGNSSGNNGQAILGKVLVFGLEEGNNSIVYSATIVGKADYSLNASSSEDFVQNLKNPDADIQLVCGNNDGQNSTLQTYIPLWQSQLMQAKDNPPGGNPAEKFSGTMIIARPLTSAVIHTAFIPGQTVPLNHQCQPSNHQASTKFKDILQSQLSENVMTEDVGICVKMDGNAVSREVRIAKDGRNTSAVSTMTEGESKCR